MRNRVSTLLTVLEISFGQLLWSKKTLFIEALALLPPAIAVLWRISIATGLARPLISPSGLFSSLMVTAYLQFLLLLVAIFYGTALIAEEVENKTLTYLTVRPIAKSVLLGGKWASYFLLSGLLLFHSILLTYGVLYSMEGANQLWAGAPVLWRDLLVMLLGVAAYGAIFCFLGAAVKRPVLVGLLFSAGWESLISYLPGRTRKLTVMHFLQSLFPHITGQDIALILPNQNASLGEAVAMIALYTAVFLALAFYTFSRRQYILDQ